MTAREDGTTLRDEEEEYGAAAGGCCARCWPGDLGLKEGRWPRLGKLSPWWVAAVLGERESREVED